MGLFGEKVTVEVLRPLGVVGVRIDVVVSEAFHVTAPERSFVGDVVELNGRVALSKLCIFEFLRVVGSDLSEE